MSGLSGVSLHLVDSTESAMAFKRWLGERRPRPVLGLDTETSGLDPYARDAEIRLIQFGDGEHGWAMSWDLWKGLALEALDEWQGDWCGHNIASFDVRWIEQHSPYRFQGHRIRDGMIAAHIVDPLGPGALKVLAQRIIDPKAASGQQALSEAMAKNKWTWATVPVDFKLYWAYGALDPVLSYKLDLAYAPQVGEGGRYAEIFDLEMAARNVVTKMQQRGSRIDMGYVQRTGEAQAQYAAALMQWCRNSYGISMRQNQSLVKLFEDLGETITVFSEKTGAKSVDKYQMEVFTHSELPGVALLAQAVLDMRRAGRNATSYFESLEEHAVYGPDGYTVHADIRTLAARTSRMSISAPPLQQIPKRDALVRASFIAREGRRLISVDYSQIEMRLMAHFSGDRDLQNAFLEADATGGDFFTIMGSEIYADSHFQKSDKRRGLVKNCVPLSSKILTKRGWLTHDEVKVGDETLGYDFSTGKNRWTEVLEVVVFDDPTPLYRFSNGQRSFVCTDNHRWVVDNGRGGPRGTAPRFAQAHEIPGTENRMILAAPAEDGDFDITPDEAALLGWVLGDGGIKRGVPDGSTSQGIDGWRVKCEVTISQTKVSEVAAIEALMDRIGIRRRLCVSAKTGQHTWYLNPDYSRDLLSRASIVGKKEFDPWALALGLTHEARVAMADAIDAADGKARRTGVFFVVQEAHTPVVELCKALGYLLGKFSRVYTVEPDGQGWQRKTIQQVMHQKPIMTGQKMTMEHVGDEPVWCVGTGLGTWTMEQDGTAYTTGNTLYGKAYGAGIGKMAESAGVPYSQMEPVVHAVDARYPGIKRFMKSVEDLGMRRLRSEGQGYVVTPYGRKLPCDEDKVYALTNYLHQGHAAEIFKRALVDLDMAGWGDYMILPVHDEVLLDVPEENVEEAINSVPKVMSNMADYVVPLTADAEGPFDNWGARYA